MMPLVLNNWVQSFKRINLTQDLFELYLTVNSGRLLLRGPRLDIFSSDLLSVKAL